MIPFQGWIANLSDGSIAFEQPPVPGEKSSWQKLLDRCTAENIKITQVRLQRNGLTLICDYHRKTDGFVVAYEALRMVFSDGNRVMQGIGSIYQDLVFMTWLDDNGNVRQDIRPLAEMRIHSTLRDVHDVKVRDSK